MKQKLDGQKSPVSFIQVILNIIKILSADRRDCTA
ncbi:unnamed protein product [Rhodiola kirilowii]